MSEKSADDKEQLPVDDVDAEDTVAASKANVSNELAKKIWSVSSSDVALGIRELPGEALPYTPADSGSGLEVESGSGPESGSGSESKQQASDNATAHILEVERALYGESYGFPENGSPNYYKAAENYSLFGEYFLDFPKDTATCFADLDQGLDSDSNPPPGFERSPKSSVLFERKQVSANGGAAAGSVSKYSGASCSTALHQQPQRATPRPQQSLQNRSDHNEIPFSQAYHQGFNQTVPQAQHNHSHHQQSQHSHASHVHPQQGQKPVGSAPQPMVAQQQQQQQHRPAGALVSGAEIGGGICSHSHGHNHNHAHGHASANEMNLSQLYQQLMARNMRPNPLHHQQQAQQHMAQNHQHHHHTTTSAAAAAAMLYANFEQHVRQLHLQQQLQQQQQRHARMPRGIYGGNGVHGGPGAAGSAAGATPPTGKEPPATGHK